MLLMIFPASHQPFRNPATVLDSMTCKVYIIENKPCRVSRLITLQKLTLPKQQNASVMQWRYIKHDDIYKCLNSYERQEVHMS